MKNKHLTRLYKNTVGIMTSQYFRVIYVDHELLAAWQMELKLH